MKKLIWVSQKYDSANFKNKLFHIYMEDPAALKNIVVDLCEVMMGYREPDMERLEEIMCECKTGQSEEPHEEIKNVVLKMGIEFMDGDLLSAFANDMLKHHSEEFCMEVLESVTFPINFSKN